MQTLFHVFPSFGIGGAQTRFVQLANYFGRRQRHFVVSIDGDVGSRAFLARDVELTFVTSPFAKEQGLRNFGAMRALYRDSKADMLLTYNWGSVEWALSNRLAPVLPRHLHFEDGFGPEEARHQIPRRVWTRRIALSGSQTEIVVPSKTLQNLALRNWRLSPKRLRYIPNGIAVEKFSTAQCSSEFPRRSELITVGTIARLRPEKNLQRLVTATSIAAASVPNLHLLIVGDGSERKRLEAYVAERRMQKQVTFFGATEQPETLLAAMDIFALSSDTEQMPISVLEAMASRLAIVSTDVGDVVNMVAAENTPFVRGRRDERALADALVQLATNAAQRDQIGMANRRKAEDEYDEQVMFARYEKLFFPS